MLEGERLTITTLLIYYEQIGIAYLVLETTSYNTYKCNTATRQHLASTFCADLNMIVRDENYSIYATCTLSLVRTPIIRLQPNKNTVSSDKILCHSCLNFQRLFENPTLAILLYANK